MTKNAFCVEANFDPYQQAEGNTKNKNRRESE